MCNFYNVCIVEKKKNENNNNNNNNNCIDDWAQARFGQVLLEFGTLEVMMYVSGQIILRITMLYYK